MRANLFPLKNFDALSKTWSLWTPGVNKGTKQIIWKDLSVLRGRNCVRIYYGHLTKLAHSRFCRPLYCVKIFTFHFYSMWSLLGLYAFNYKISNYRSYSILVRFTALYSCTWLQCENETYRSQCVYLCIILIFSRW